MKADELFRAGKLKEAIQALTGEVRQDPQDARRRTFLFELLCFAGEWERAEKQLDVLAQGGQNAELGALLYRSALRAEGQRRKFIQDKAYLGGAAPAAGQPPATGDAKPAAGSFNGKPFQDIADADPRIGRRLEVFLAGRYLWVPFEHIVSIQMQPPKRLRDLLWAPAIITNGPNFQGRDLGEVLVPVLAPFTATHEDDMVRLGRASAWKEVDGAEIPFGQKLLLIDGEEVPLLELRNVKLAGAGETAAAG
jgi:type VI secretion system protein ImpE